MQWTEWTGLCIPPKECLIKMICTIDGVWSQHGGESPNTLGGVLLAINWCFDADELCSLPRNKEQPRFHIMDITGCQYPVMLGR